MGAALADGQKTVPLGEQGIFSKNGVSVTANTLRYGADTIEIDFTIKNTGGGGGFLFFREMYVNNWLVPIVQDDMAQTLEKGAVDCTVRADTSDTALMDMMQLEEVQTVKFAVTVFNANYYVQSRSSTKEIVNPDAPAGYVQTVDATGTVLRDDDAIRIVQKAYDPKARTALVMIEKKQTSKWTELTLDALYNGCRALRSELYVLDKGVRALVRFDGTEDCSHYAISAIKRMDIYVSYYHSDRLQTPYAVTLQADGAPASEEKYMPSFDAAPVYEDENCALYYAGAISGYYSDSDVVMFYCKNKTADKTLALFTAYSYVLLDGERVETSQANVNIYPESVSQVVLLPQNPGYFDLSGCDKLETTLGVYEIRGGYHEQLATTGKLALALHGINNPLQSPELVQSVET